MSLGGYLLHNLVLFGRLLRAVGLDVDTSSVIDLSQSLSCIEIGSKHDFYFASRTILVHRREDLELYDLAFELFWRRLDQDIKLLPDRGGKLVGNLKRNLQQAPTAVPKEMQTMPCDPESDDSLPEEVAQPRQTYSPREVLRHKDFSEMTVEELDTLRQMMRKLSWHMGERRTRRQKPGKGHNLDLRRSMRHCLRTGGEVLKWEQRAPKFKPRPLVVIADISGSMERYTRLLLQFVYSLVFGLSQPVEVFVFGTRLTRITHQLRIKDVDQALMRVSKTVIDWSGGTRIGESLKSFNYSWGRRVLGRGAVVVMISDGWERGDIPLLHREMARLQRSCHRLIWLNPLLGQPGYEPLTLGMQAALRYIDDFLPAHNLSSLEDFAQHLVTLDEQK